VKQQAESMGVSNKAAKDGQMDKAQKAAKKMHEDNKKAEIAALFSSSMIKQQVCLLVFTFCRKYLSAWIRKHSSVHFTRVLSSFNQTAGQCTKGSKCKFSHDMDVERKAEKINLYADNREENLDKSKDTMDGWDQAKLENVIGEMNLNTSTEIVCKHFIEAVEIRKYGWFWTCPSGDACKYRHALPPGYVLRPRESPEGNEN
jgi:hypothetical protein